jgi:hypothetical protein
MGVGVQIVDGLHVEAKPWRHRKVVARTVEFSGASDGRTIKLSFSGQQPGSHFSPRHRHNFDQIRFFLSGHQQFGGLEYYGGDCGYFPEGVFYGPHGTVEGPSETVNMQTQGPAWAPFMTRAKIEAAAEQLEQEGAFDREKGIFQWAGGRRQDSYEACWEKASGTKVSYVKSDIKAPFLIRGRDVEWQPLAGVDGAEVKEFASFNDIGPTLQMIRLQPGAALLGGLSTGHHLATLIAGQVDYEGRQLARGHYFYYAPGCEFSELRAIDESVFTSVRYKVRAPMAPEPSTDEPRAVAVG